MPEPERLIERLCRLNLFPVGLIPAAAQQAHDELHVVRVVLDQQHAQGLPGNVGTIRRRRRSGQIGLANQ